MSILSELDTENFSNIVEILNNYDEKLKNWKKHLVLEDKNIEKANIEQISYLAYYDEIKVELKTLLDFFDMKVKEIRGKVLTLILNKSRLDVQEKSRERMIDSDPQYIKIYQIYLEIKEVYSLADSIVQQFRDRAFALDKLVKIHIAGIQDITLVI